MGGQYEQREVRSSLASALGQCRWSTGSGVGSPREADLMGGGLVGQVKSWGVVYQAVQRHRRVLFNVPGAWGAWSCF